MPPSTRQARRKPFRWRFFALSIGAHLLPLLTLPALGIGFSCNDALVMEAARRDRRELLVVTLRPLPVEKQGQGSAAQASGQSEIVSQPLVVSSARESLAQPGTRARRAQERELVASPPETTPQQAQKLAQSIQDARKSAKTTPVRRQPALVEKQRRTLQQERAAVRPDQARIENSVDPAAEPRDEPRVERLTADGLRDLPVKVALAGELPDRKSVQSRELLLVSATQLTRTEQRAVVHRRASERWQAALPRPIERVPIDEVGQREPHTQQGAQAERAWAPRSPQQLSPLEVELAEPAPATRKVRIQVQVKQLAARPRVEDGEAAAQDDDVAGDRTLDVQPDVHAIAQAVARVLPYVYWDWPRRGQVMGRTVVRFRLNADGYVNDASVISSTGTVRLGRESGEALTLASPYAFVPGWIELTLTFRG